MNSNAHTQKIENQISRSLGFMNRLKRYLPQGIVKTLYKRQIMPRIQYATRLWGFKSSRILKL